MKAIVIVAFLVIALVFGGLTLTYTTFAGSVVATIVSFGMLALLYVLYSNRCTSCSSFNFSFRREPSEREGEYKSLKTCNSCGYLVITNVTQQLQKLQRDLRQVFLVYGGIASVILIATGTISHMVSGTMMSDATGAALLVVTVPLLVLCLLARVILRDFARREQGC